MLDPKKEIQIGQVVYVLSNKTQAIVPALVVEETTVNTLEGKRITWKVAVGPEGPKRKVVDSTNLNGEIFSSLKDVEEYLKTRLTKIIDKAVSDAHKNESVWYSKIKPQTTNVPNKPQTDNGKLDPESLISDFNEINEGSYGQEQHYQKNMQQISHEEQQERLKKHLREQIAPTKEELQADIQPEPEQLKIRSITGPGGEQFPIDFKV